VNPFSPAKAVPVDSEETVRGQPAVKFCISPQQNGGKSLVWLLLGKEIPLRSPRLRQKCVPRECRDPNLLPTNSPPLLKLVRFLTKRPARLHG